MQKPTGFSRYKLSELEQLEKKGLIEYFNIKHIIASKELFYDEETRFYWNMYQNSYEKISGIGVKRRYLISTNKFNRHHLPFGGSILIIHPLERLSVLICQQVVLN